ncbi:unnamed protein product, partial [Arabidopsis halleri]
MRVFCWNIRGLNSHSRQSMVRSWVASNNLLVGSFLETHVSEANASAVLASVLPDQMILCSIKLPSVSRSFAIAFVYGKNTTLERRVLWEDISSLASSTPLNTTPCPLLGDFNQIANSAEHFFVIQSSLPLSGMEDLQNCLRDNEYFSFLSSHPTFLSSISTAWADQILVGSSMFSLGERLKSAKKCCKRLNRIGFGNIQQRTKEALESLEIIQTDLLSSPSDSLFREEHVARKKWNFFAAALESFYRQKSRIKWLKDGDANTRFFHRVVLAHQARNLISYLRGPSNERLYSVEKIQTLQPFRCDADLAAKLVAIPTEFFWEAWPVVKDNTLKAFRDFFRNGHLLPKFNATAITLIPKVPGADHLSKFRPVAYCNTVYKIITRLLSKQLQLFISDAVQDSRYLQKRVWIGKNRQKTALMLDGGDFERNRSMAARFNLTHGALPVRYLGVPLMAPKMRRQDYQPLIDRINNRFSSWTARHLSYAGRLQLLKSVIYSNISFWTSIFILPNQCLLKLEQMCCAFLWKGAPDSPRGAKISWDVVCSSKDCGGLGLRRLSSWNKVLALKLIW